jgi:16S rRNA (cytosine1402-N4)-methyltransferase
MSEYHTPVLLKETLKYLNVKKGKKYIDATVGGGGHAEAILKLGGEILGIDYDPEAIKAAREHLSQACPSARASGFGGQRASWRLAQGNFDQLGEIAKKNGFEPVAGILFDLGVSSHQLDDLERGFSFQSEATLDMRMNPNLGVTAADLINGLNKGELNELFSKLAEEKHSRRLAEAVVSACRVKPVRTCRELADLVVKTVGKKGKVHPATRIFQALRIAVNDELNNLKEALPQAVELLKPEGRLVIISFHSGEDRIVKQFLKDEEKLKILNKKPVRPTEAEIKANPRSRSAKLRAGERLK